jgi:hypothetical protein
MILNGSTTKMRPPTSLPLTAVTGIVLAGLKVKGFPTLPNMSTEPQHWFLAQVVGVK